jgi:hypothetical protein
MEERERKIRAGIECLSKSGVVTFDQFLGYFQVRRERARSFQPRDQST